MIYESWYLLFASDYFNFISRIQILNVDSSKFKFFAWHFPGDKNIILFNDIT